MLKPSEVLAAAQLDDFEAAQSPRIAAARALDFERGLEPDKICGRADVLRGHRDALARKEQEGNKAFCGNRAKAKRLRR